MQARRTIAIIVTLLAQSVVLNAWGQGSPGASAYDQAATLLQQGKVAEAEGVLRAELQAHPKDAHELDLLGTVLDTEKRFEDAEEIYSRAVSIAPDSPSLLNNLGNHYAMRGQIERARAAYSRVVGLDPHHTNANLHLAQISIGNNDGRAALQFLDNLREADRSLPAAQLLRAQALHLNGQQDAGLDVLKHLEKQFAKTQSVIFSVGLTYAEWGRYDDAERAFTDVLADDPADADVLYNLGLAATHSGHLKRAEEAFQAALGQRPDDVDALMGLVRICAAQGQEARSVELLNKARRLARQRPEILFSLAQIEERQGSYEESTKVLAEYLKLQPNDSVAQRELAFALAHTVEFDRGLTQLTSYVATHTQDPMGFYELALVETEGAREKAVPNLNQAIAIDPDLLPARYARAFLDYQAGKASESVNDLTFILGKSPRDYRALDLLGEAQVALNQDKEAINSFRQAAQLAPNESRVLMHYSRALLQANQVEESQAVMRELANLPQVYSPVRLFTSAGAGHNDLTDSVNNPKDDVPPRSNDTDGTERQAEIELAKGEIEKALIGFEWILRHASEATVLAQCGRVLLQSGQYAEGRKFLEKAAAYPNSPPDVQLDLAIALFHSKGADAALLSLEQTPVEKRGGDWYLLVAQLLMSSGKYREAIVNLNRGLAASPTRPDLFFEAARLLLDYGRARSHYNEAADFLEKAGRFFPTDPKLLLSQAVLYGLLGRLEDAEHTLAKTELRWPDWGRPYLVNGIILVNLGRPAEAKPLLKASIALGDGDTLAYFNLALASFNKSPRELDDAEKAITQASWLAPRDAYVQWLAGKISYARQDYPGALQHLQAALASQPDMVEAHMQLSATYRAMGEKEKSLAELKEVSRIKVTQRGTVSVPAHSVSLMEGLLSSGQLPH